MNNKSTLLTKNVIFYSFLSIFIFLFVRLLLNNYFDSYVFEEWLVNYSQGFVRRGLAGTFLLFLNQYYNINIFDTIRYFSYAIFLVFSGIYIFKVKQSERVLNSESLLVVLFLPSLILFPIHEPQVIGRKEFLFFLGLIINLFLLQKTLKNLNILSGQESYYENPQNSENVINKYCYNLFTWYNLLSIPTALSHEAIVFLAVPLNMIITASLIRLAFTVKQTLWRTLIIYLPTIFIAFICLIWKGNSDIVLGICESWRAYNYKDLAANCGDKLSGVLTAFKISFIGNLELNLSTNVLRWYGANFMCWMLIFFLNTVILMRTSSSILINSGRSLQNLDENPSQIPPVELIASFSFKYALIPFIFSFIMYVVALDWGRWFFISSITYTLCLLTPSLIRLEIIGYDRNNWILKTLAPIYLPYLKLVGYLYNQHLLNKFRTIYFFGFIFTLFVFKLAHFGMSFKQLFRGLLYNLFLSNS
jgi:hypothetical protein